MAKTQKERRVKRLVLHFQSIVSKVCKDLEIDPHTKSVVLRRLHHEGPAFCTKILPKFSKYALACIEARSILRAPSLGLTHFETKGGIPLFMRVHLVEAIQGNPVSLYKIRQLCEYFYKTAFEMNAASKSAAEKAYRDTDLEVGPQEFADPVDWNFVERCRKTASSLFQSLTRVKLSDVFEYARPRNSPGAFVDSEKLSTPMELYKKLDSTSFYPHTLSAHAGFFKPLRSVHCKSYRLDVRRICDIRFVPKDSRGPRTISKEEYGTIQGQMAFNDYLTAKLERLSAGRVLFSDQSVHRELAKKASIDRLQSTLDLKEASDRIRMSVVSHIFQDFPFIREATRTLRATHYRLPSGEVKPLHKYANMGSGLCFPILAFTIYIAAITSLRSHTVPSSIDASSVYVYGDDVICRTCDVSRVIKGLERIGLKINHDKSFSNGFFRESCGGDYFHGQSVVPVRLRLSNAGLPTIEECRNGAIPISRDIGYLALERHCRELMIAGMKNTADYYYRILEKKFSDLPIVGLECSALGRFDPNKVVPPVNTEAYVPISVKLSSSAVGPYKGLAASLSSLDGLGDDWCLTPLRRQISLKRRVVEAANRVPYGVLKL